MKNSIEDKILQARELLEKSDGVLISASNGLSIAEGFNIFKDDKNFRKYFNEFKTLYGIGSLIQGVFAQLPESEHRIFMRRVHQYLIDDYQPTETFSNLKKIIGKKDYFVVTSNADTHFQLNEFDNDCIWEVEGNFDGLVENSLDWKKQKSNFQEFINNNEDKKVVQLELGIGANNRLIKQPLMNLVAQTNNWSFITLNMPSEINIAPEIANRSIALPGDINQTFQELLVKE
ncbi:hypothetical protein [Companilactobacillus musae]|uniref:hypothetical protein n=1 Tax=Companilactobacillus musae TaxID=1903258 RepID=UPI001FED18BF|nr:hypothetical protein [Companilactobacillus musae]